jgi:hypothetical protein
MHFSSPGAFKAYALKVRVLFLFPPTAWRVKKEVSSCASHN